MRRPVWAVLIALCLILLVVRVIQIIPGPRASVPSAPAATTSSTGHPTGSPTRTAVGLPDPNRTPGSINPNVTQGNIATTICTTGWTATVRPPSAYTNALKVAQIVEYGYTDRSLSHYEEDHLVPLELGGAPRDPRNLWPEPNVIALPDGTTVGSEAKDHLENYLHAAVCAGVEPLADAQRLIAGDWIAAWINAGSP